MKGKLRELVELARSSRREIDPSPFQGELPGENQKAFALEVLDAMGFDLQAGRVDTSAHPFCSSQGPGDVRITWRFSRNDLRPGFFGLVHEAGHALYEQGLDPSLFRTPAGSAVSLGVHESQSRLWENMVARSLPFWQAFGPLLKKHLPGINGPASPEVLFKAANMVKPSPIRVEADETTYNLHILLRFSLEKRLFKGDLEVEDLATAWKEETRELLGIELDDDSQGVLQDIHWSLGAFGYFPTYTLGNIYAAQLFEAAGREIGDLEEIIRRKELKVLKEWLGKKIHRHCSLLPPKRLIKEATGKEPSSESLLSHLEKRVRAVYGD